MNPIFFAWTRSFWLGAAGTLTMIYGAPPAVIDSIASVVATVTPLTAEGVSTFIQKSAPAVLFLASLQQRSGAARPYTIDPTALG